MPPTQDPSMGLGLSQDQMRSNLSGLMDSLQNKYRDLSAARFRSDNDTESLRKQTLTKVLKMFQDAGIDVTDSNAVQEFLNQLQQTNPDMYDLFANAFTILLSGEPEAQLPAEMTQLPMQGDTPMPEVPQSPVFPVSGGV